jgi:hypothetical protein
MRITWPPAFSGAAAFSLSASAWSDVAAVRVARRTKATIVRENMSGSSNNAGLFGHEPRRSKSAILERQISLSNSHAASAGGFYKPKMTGSCTTWADATNLMCNG